MSSVRLPVLLSFLLLALVCAHTAIAQAPAQAPHPITGLPLPPEEEPATPAKTAPTPAPAPAPAAMPSVEVTARPSTPGNPAPTLVIVEPETPAPAAPVVKTGPFPKKPVPAPDAVPAPPTVSPAPVAPEPPPPVPIVAAPARTSAPPAAASPNPVALPVAPPVPPPAAPAIRTVPVIQPTASPVAAPQPTPGPTPGPVPAAAAVPAAPGTLGDIVFLHPGLLTPAELRPLTGLTLGVPVTARAVKAADQSLIDTGFYANVETSYDAPGGVDTATFALQPVLSSQLRHVSLANLIWLTPAELDATLKTVPLYHGVVPTGGDLHLDAAIQTALDQALAARGVTATLTHADLPASPQHPYPAIEYRVTQPSVVLASALVYDIPPALIAATLKAQDAAVKLPYNEGIAGTTLSDILLAPAREAGYIAARLYRVERKRKVAGGIVYVDYSARLEAGPVVTVRSLLWTTTPVLSTADLRRRATLRPGQVPTAAAVTATQDYIVNAYLAQGYLEAALDTQVALDAKPGAATGAVDYTFSVAPGPQYTLRTLNVSGLPPAAQQDFDAAWAIKPGDIYNEVYLLNFLKDHTNLATLKGYSFQFSRTATPDTHQVDLTLVFKPVK